MAIRVIQFLPKFSKKKIRENLISSLQKRNELRKTTNAYRILHGENDFFPGITIDRLNETWVVRIYSSSLLSYGRWLVWNLYDLCKNSKLGEPKPKRILFDPPEKTGTDKIGSKKANGTASTQTIFDSVETLQDDTFKKSNLKVKKSAERLWRGRNSVPAVQKTKSNHAEAKANQKKSDLAASRDTSTQSKPLADDEPLKIRETIQLYDIRFPVELPGQKGGIFLDLRNLRRFLLEKKELSQDKNCLHLFSHTGLTSICMDVAGAASVLSADGSKEVLDGFQRVLSLKKNQSHCKHRFVQKNLFKELEEVLENRKFGLIVIDPPNLTPDAKSKTNALKSYSYLFENSLTSLEESGTIILCSCSGRIGSEELESLAKNIFKSKGWSFERFTSLKPEADHPVRKNFPEGNYFKVHIYENCKKNGT